MHQRHARIRVSRRKVRFTGIFSVGKAAVSIALLVAIAVGAMRHLDYFRPALALQFTQHAAGTKTSAIGVLGVAIGDMQNDGRQDIVTAGYDGVKVYIQTAAKVFEEKVVDDVRGERIVLADFNDDDLQDILITADSNPSVKVYINQGGTEFSKTWLGTGSKAAAAAGDIDGDGTVDVVTSLDQEGGDYTLQRWMNSGAGVFTSTTLATSTGITALAIADINSNGYQDIIAGGTKGLQHWDTSNGTTWSREDIDSSQTKFTAFALGDVNADDKVDIIAGNQSDNTVTYYQHLQHAFYTKIALNSDTDAANMQVVDFNEDGYMDIVAASQDENTVYWFQNDGEQEFTRSVIADGIQNVFGIAVADVDGDDDFDFVTGDHTKGNVYWYERTHAKPTASEIGEIAQMTDGSGRVIFTTTIAQEDFSRTSLRVEYSIDGISWHKAYLASVKPSTGKVDVNHDNPYQVGTTNPIDTDTSSVKLTIVWDSKSTKNLGGPLTGDNTAVQIKLIPKDSVGLGQGVKSASFSVDNQIPRIAGSLSASAGFADSATLSWSAAEDRATASYRIYYGTDSDAVKSQTSDVWDDGDDDALEERTTTTTTISGLSSGSLYTFKLVATDAFGNEAAWPSVSATIGSATTPIVTVTPLISPAISATPAPSADASVSFTPAPTADPSPIPSTTENNVAPVADAGSNQIVNPSALVILDGSGSYDTEGDLLTYVWTQIAGPTVDLVSDRTINPSFSAGLQEDSYVFQLIVKDENGASDVDLVTVAVQPLPQASAIPAIAQISPIPSPSISSDTQESSSVRTFWIWAILRPVNIALFAISILLILILFLGHAFQGARARDIKQVKQPHKDLPSFQSGMLQSWQNIQRFSQAFSWPAFFLGAIVNTALLFIRPDILLLVIEALYVVFVIVKVAIEVRSRPAYGLVRDALTHAPLDLAIVRLFTQDTNWLIMTRVADAEGKFFALPPAGTYMISITKPGYGAFSREHIVIESGGGSILNITADLMPVVPQGGYSKLQAGVA